VSVALKLARLSTSRSLSPTCFNLLFSSPVLAQSEPRELIELIATLQQVYNIPLNTRDNLGNTPLHYSVMYSFREPVVEYLLNNGAKGSVMLPNGLGRVPLHTAVLTLNTSLISLLLPHMDSINLQDAEGKTPLVSTSNISIHYY
jgi:ankyrin repeat protein